MSTAMQPCPADSPLMKAWTAYQETDDFKNNLMWATVTTYRQAGRDVPDEANEISSIQREQHAKGSLWAAFVQGFNRASNEKVIVPATGEEWVLVPTAALKWLFGEGPDENGFDFGMDPDLNYSPPYWWRSKFRAMLASAPPSPAPQGWRTDMENAPRGRGVLVTDGKLWTLGAFRAVETQTLQLAWPPIKYETKHLWVVANSHIRRLDFKPTHWCECALPLPPTGGER